MCKKTRIPKFAATVFLASYACLLPGRAAEFDHVIHISVDALHAEKLRHQLFARPEDFPSMQRLVDESASTFNARTDFFKTYTLPNHTTMLTGRPVLQAGDDPTLHHGYTRNGTPAPTATLHNSGNPAVDYVSSIFDLFHDYGYSTALYTSKSKFVIYEQSYNETEFTPPGRSDQYLANGDQGPNKIDTYVYDRVGSSSTVLVDRFVSDMESDPYNYAFLHLRELDSIGHAQGWGTTPWEEGLEQIDEHLGKVFTLIDSNSNLRGNTAVIVTTDHGGWAVSHGDSSDPNNFTIPVFVWAPGFVAAGTDLYALNRYTRTDPGILAPEYTVTGQPIRNGDTGNLALALVGLPSVDGSSINLDQDLIVTHPDDAYWHGANGNGMLGDGTTWSDARNWARGDVADSRFFVGDRVMFTSNAQETSIDLEHAQVVSSLDFFGSYTLAGGALKVTSGNVVVAEESVATLNLDVTSPISMMKRGLGTLTLNGLAPNVFLSEGTLRGQGSIGAVISRGRVEPGDGIGTLLINGAFDNRSNASMEFEFNGSDASQRDLIQVESTASIFGALHIVFGVDFEQPSNRGQADVIPLIQATTVVGQFREFSFDGVEFPRTISNERIQSSHLGGGLFQVVLYDQDSVELASYLAIPGDANGDFAVDVVDFNLWNENRSLVGTDWTEGDFNGDGMSDAADLAIWQENVFTSVVPSLAAVPEPSSMPILVIGFLIAATRRNRRRMRGLGSAGDAARPHRS